MKAPQDDLKAKVLIGTGWVAATIFISRGLQTIGGLLLLRILEPTMFGIYGMVMTYIGIMSIGTDMGLRQAIIQRPELEGEDLNEALQFFFLAFFFKGLFLGLATWFVAPLAAAFFQTPEVTPLVQISGLCLIARSAISPGTVTAERDMNLRKVELVIQTSRGIALIATLALALYLRNAWSLLLGTLVGDLTHVLLSFVVFPFAFRARPFLKWARNLFGFAKHILFNQIFNTAILQTDKLIVARMLDKTAFGFFDKAQNIMVLSAVQMAQVLGKVGLPMFSKLNRDPHRAGRAWMRLLRYTSTFGVPPFVVLAIFASPLVTLLLQPDWQPMIPLLQIFSIFGILRILSMGTAAMLMGMGYPQIPSVFNGIRLMLLLTGLPWAIHRFDLIGAAWGTSLAFLLTTVPLLAACAWIGKIDRSTIRSLLTTPFAANVALIVFGLTISRFTPTTVPWLMTELSLCGLLYGSILLLDPEFRSLPRNVFQLLVNPSWKRK